MGCEVNRPGEAHDSQLGVTSGKGVGMIFKDGRPMRKVSGANIFYKSVAARRPVPLVRTAPR